MIAVRFEPEFNAWRAKARELIASGVSPDDVQWTAGPQSSLFEESGTTRGASLRVPRAFRESAEIVACHRDESKWALLYRVLYRLCTGEAELLQVVTDPDVHRLNALERQVSHDMHRMKAFVRFREIHGRYVAWYEPDHLIVPRLAPWFAARFGDMHWSILTPDACAHWDTQTLSITSGVCRSSAPAGDPIEDLWRSYYVSTFNPSRVNVKLMRSHLPVRKWSLLPEAPVFAEAIRNASGRSGQMLADQPGLSAAQFIPQGATLPVLREAVRTCQGCELYRCATQPVFGVGPSNASVALVGEQPGDQEDREGRPFVGPSGQLLDEALDRAGLRREDLYITGAVKHFRYEQRGKQRIHKTASKAHIAACHPWLAAELELVNPRLIVCMGNTAALSVLGRSVRLLEERGRILPHKSGAGVLLTVHPGFLLRIPGEARKADEYARFVDDLSLARSTLLELPAHEQPRPALAR